MPLTVLSVAYPLAATGEDAVGGAEQILSTLDRALVEAGHRSLVVAQGGSKIAGELLPTFVPAGQITNELRAAVAAQHQANIDRVLASERIDVMHLHGIDFAQYRAPAHIPALATLHLPPSWYPERIWRRTHVQLQCVSRSQRESCPPGWHDLPVIENGVPIGPVRQTHRRGFALALGRICAEKNLHVALDAGTLAGIPVLIGGQVFPYAEHEHYFVREIAPRLRKGRHRFLGPLGRHRKQRLLRAAKCLLLPTLAPETSSLVAMEAMTEGTPVVAYPSGAIPEIVRDGVTGFLVRSPGEMADAIARTDAIDPAVCRRDAEKRFSASRMVDEYLALYRQLAEGHLRRVG